MTVIAQRCPRCLAHGPFHPSQEGKNGAWCKPCLDADYRDRRAGGMVTVECGWCLESFQCTARSAARRQFCTRACKDAANLERGRVARYLARPHRSCPHCGVQVPRGKRADASFCSSRCEEAAHNATRKATWKTGHPAVYVSRAQIVERDEGRCHICGDFPGAEALHLDHIVPLARGGTHDAANLAVACATCNLAKGARLT